MRASVKFQWHHDRIEAYTSKLEKLQSSLTLATTLALRSRTIGNNKEVISHLKLLQDGNGALQKNHDRVLELTRTTNAVLKEQSGPKLNAIQSQVEDCLKSIESLRSDMKRTRETNIMYWLDFRQRTWRYDEVEAAYQKTFEWIFKDDTDDTPWNSFVDYLSGTEVSLPYFINGKAGSGKSTLMKFITGHTRTMVALRKWAGDHELLVLNFFFWNLGTDLQKNHVGMLRALLHSILEKYPEFIPVVFPRLYCNSKRLDKEEAPSYAELKSAFELLQTRSAKFLRLCIFIDGVDEFEGDHRDMAMFLCSLASPHIKVVVSSRPINACLRAFHQCPTLHLQDLTRHDMELFIEGQLCSNSIMNDLRNESPEESSQLIEGIKVKAEGVFLWVKLVVRILLRGLEDGDDISDLMEKLRSLPSDLRTLYSRMMQKMQPEYQVQASQIFQIFEHWRKMTHNESLESIALAFAVHPPSFGLKLPVALIEEMEKNRLIERLEARIRSRCCGLLEVRKVSAKKPNGSDQKVVMYLHRTVAEFLTVEKMWDDIRSLTQGTKFDPVISLAFGFLCMLKTSDFVPSSKNDTVTQNLFLATALGCSIPDDQPDLITRHLLALDEAMTVAMSQASKTKQWAQMMNSTFYRYELAPVSMSFRCLQDNQKHHWSVYFEKFLIRIDTISVSDEEWLCAHANLDTWAAYSAHFKYLELIHKSEQDAGMDEPSTPIPVLILFALSSWRDRPYTLSVRSATLTYLLTYLQQISEDGIETEICGRTLWNHAVILAHHLLKLEKNGAENRVIDAGEILKVFLSFAKNPKAIINKNVQSQRYSATPREMIHKVIVGGRYSNAPWELREQYASLHPLVS